MSKAQTDIRRTSYNVATANPYGYTGSIDDAIAQIRAEPDEVREPRPTTVSSERHELLYFLGALKPKTELSGMQVGAAMPVVYVFPLNENEDWSVEYGAPEHSPKPSFYSLAYAQEEFPECFVG